MRYLASAVLFSATFCFALGITLPLIAVTRLMVFSDTPSLVGIVWGLWRSGDPLLAIVISLFSIVFPTTKLVFLHIAAYGGGPGHVRVPASLRALSNWSMLDVVLVALVVFAAKTSGLAEAFTRPGLWFFAASALLTAAASALVKNAERPRI